VTTFPAQGDALELLEYEDRVLERLLDRLLADDDALTHGVAGKLLISHLAVREAAKEMVADALDAHRIASGPGARLEAGTMARREMIARLDDMARGLRPIDLNQGQDFDAAVEPLRRLLTAEIHAELDELLPALRRQLSDEQRRAILPSARYVEHHAPTHPNPRAKHHYERVGPLTRLHAWYDRMREYPTGRAWARAKLSEMTEFDEVEEQPDEAPPR
jgi:hypothetical protein